MNAGPFAVTFKPDYQIPFTFFTTPSYIPTDETLTINEYSFDSSLSSTPTDKDEIYSPIPSTTQPDEDTPQSEESKVLLLPSRRVGRKPEKLKNKEKCFPFLLDCHDNKKEDNMIKKIKPHYHKFLVQYVNNCIKKLGKKTLLKKLEGKFNSNISISQNKLLLDTTLCNVLSKNISKRFENFDKDYNKNVINTLITENEYLKGLLNLTYEYIYTNVFIKPSNDIHTTCYDNVYINYFKNEIPKEFLFEELVHKQERSLQSTLKAFGEDKFIWKISNGISRSRKMKNHNN